jgi:hypothetical protein
MTASEKVCDKNRLKEANEGDCRVVINGKRHYKVPLGTGYAPSVTTVLSETASEASKKKLLAWGKKNPGKKEEAAERGTFIHSKMEHYLADGEKNPEIPDEYKDFWDGMPSVLDQFGEVLWAENPLKDEYKFTIGGDGIARVWAADEGRAWVGAPDIVAYAEGKLTLADLKTTVKPYSRYFPKDAEKGSQEWRDLFTGNIKFKKTLKQLAAYDLGLQQTLDIKVDQAAILVSTPERCQVFKISRRFLDMLHDDWKKIVQEYYNQLEEQGPTDYDAY